MQVLCLLYHRTGHNLNLHGDSSSDSIHEAVANFQFGRDEKLGDDKYC